MKTCPFYLLAFVHVRTRPFQCSSAVWIGLWVSHLIPPRRSCTQTSVTSFKKLPCSNGQGPEKANTKYNKRLQKEDNPAGAQTSSHSAVHKGQTHKQIFPAVSASWSQIWREDYNRSTQHETKKLQKFPLRMNIWTTVIIRAIAARLFAISLNNSHYLETEFKNLNATLSGSFNSLFLMNCMD